MKKHKIALITGATAGIGKACAARFAALGWNLILTGRREDRLHALKRELQDAHGIDVWISCYDVRSYHECEAAIQALPPAWKAIDLLINNAGLAVGRSPVQESELDDWERMVDTNVKGLMYMTRLVSEIMVERKTGHIINLGSIAGREVYPGGNAYCATKFAVEGFSRAIRIDLAPHNVRVTSISPGMVETEFSIVRFKGDETKAAQVYQGVEPLVAEDIAECVVWAATLPPHVCINDINLTCTAQPSANIVHRK